MKRLIVACAVFCLLGSPTWAGVVMEMEVRNADAAGKTGAETFYAEGEMTRTDFLSANGKDSSLIFRDQTMYFVDHAGKVCQKIDKAGVDQLSSQMNAMMKQMANMPPEQRQMMEKMMKGRMPGMGKPPVRRVEEGGMDQVGEYPCRLFTLFSDDQKVQEFCMADAGVEADLYEAMEAIHALSRFAESLMKVAENSPFGKMFELPFKDVHEMDGYPVRTRMFDGHGKVAQERTLKTITRRDIEKDLFEIPKGYKVKSLEKMIQGGR